MFRKCRTSELAETLSYAMKLSMSSLITVSDAFVYQRLLSLSLAQSTLVAYWLCWNLLNPTMAGLLLFLQKQYKYLQ